MQKRTFQRIFSLGVKQKWLGPLENELHSLIEECESDEQVDLVADLLHRFQFIDQSGEDAALQYIVTTILSLNVAEGETQIVATSADDDADSGQAVLYRLKPLFARSGWGGVKLVNQFTKAQRNVPDKPVVCLVDEFVGTGRSMLGRLKALTRDFKNNKKFTDGRFFVFAYAGMKAAKELLLESGLCEGVYFARELDRGISDAFMGDELQEMIERMEALENKLLPSLDGYNLPSFGDGRCEALYGREGGNAPNSVFPVFWWPKVTNGSDRKTLLVRKI